MGIDDFLRQVEADELEDKLAEQTHATPIEYAKLRSQPGNVLAPQRVYYYIRNNRLPTYNCQCGRRVIPIAEADELFGFTPNKEPGNLYSEEVKDETSTDLQDSQER